MIVTPKIFLDMDGVLVDYAKGAHSFFNKEYIYGQTTWDFYKKWGLDDYTFFSYQNEEFWANLPPTNECDSVINACVEAVGRENVCLLTSPCFTNGSVQGKFRWIIKYCPEFRNQVLFGEPKHFCANTIHTLLIDDNLSNIQQFAQAGGAVILFKRPWNSAFRNTSTLSDFLDDLEAWRTYIFKSV